MQAFITTHAKRVLGLLLSTNMLLACGCYAPLKSGGIQASTLPEEFRAPLRTGGPLLNYTNLTAPVQTDYLLGADDVLEVTVPELFDKEEFRPLRVQVMSSGEIQLPLVGAVQVGGMNLLQAQAEITKAYANGFFNAPRIGVFLAEKATVSVVVLGNVATPGVVLLPRYENDVAHAVAQAGGLAEDAADVIEVHRKERPHMPQVHRDLAPLPGVARPASSCVACSMETPTDVLTIRLRGQQQAIHPQQVTLQTGDVIVVPSRRGEVFYVVGLLNPNNNVRFTSGGRERELGGGFILPRDREIDVVTAVAMAGYIDPINSPTTVTVHRQNPHGPPLLIKVDLIKARYCREENINVAPGDIIYLNPDAQWYFRRTFDRLLDDIILFPYRRALGIGF